MDPAVVSHKFRSFVDICFGGYATNEILTSPDSQSDKVPYLSTEMTCHPAETEELVTDINKQSEEIPVRNALGKSQVSASQAVRDRFFAFTS